jgi:hypothetical protein
MSRDPRSEVRVLRLELLRMRASMQRDELADAVAELRHRTGNVRGVMSGLGGLSAGVAARSGWIGLVASLVRRPWAAAMALSVVRALKRRPVFGAAAVVAGLAAWGASRMSRPDAERDPAASRPARETPRRPAPRR